MTAERSGASGWRQFLTSKAGMLAAYDNAKNRATSRPVKSHHGNVAEAVFREWLSNFLPKRYAVTPGYIVSQRFGEPPMIHFDVIIYDQIESPVLWIDSDPDASSQGNARAIPAEHVKAVLEVKGTFSTAAAAKAIKHLSELSSLLIATEPPDLAYKRFLPHDFLSATVFFELRKEHQYNAAALDHLAMYQQRGYIGGLILRGHDRDPLEGAVIHPFSSTMSFDSSVGRREQSLLCDVSQSKSHPSGEQHLGVIVTWNTTAFAEFAFDLVARLAGTFKPGFLSSYHGFNYRTTSSNAGA